jgi:hypothetical protein
VDGNLDFSSSNCLRIYLPKHAEELFMEHGVGLGVFTMQG